MNINLRYVQRKSVVNNVEMSSFKEQRQNGPYKTYTQNKTKTRRTLRRQTLKNLFLCFSDFSFLLYYYFLSFIYLS